MNAGIEGLVSERPRVTIEQIEEARKLAQTTKRSVVQLLDEGNSIPFISRYRKERTGGLHEDVIRRIQARVRQLRQLADRKQTILKSIDGHGKLSDELKLAILEKEKALR